MNEALRRVVVLLGVIACSRDDHVRTANPPGSAAPAGAGAAAQPRATAPAAARRTILFVGTSITAGLGLDAEDAYPAIISRKIDSAGLRYDVVNAGTSGETSAGALRRIDWLLRGPVDVFVLETGANDGLRGLSVDSMRSNIQAILDRVKAAKPQAQILLMQMEAPPNMGPRYTAEFRRVFAELAGANEVTLVPFVLEGVAGEPSLNQADGIHPNERGERIVAENVWRALLPALDRSN